MSALQDAIPGYLSMRRGLGHKLAVHSLWLADFATFMEARSTTVITNKLALDWTTYRAGPASWPNRLAAIRGFARHLSFTEPRTEIPPAGILPQPRRRSPHIYTEPEITSILDAMLALVPTKRLRRWTYYSVLGLLAATGMRIGEALGLKRDDVDLDDGILTIRETKFGKSRIVPIHPSTIAALSDYAGHRDARRSRAVSPYFFTGEHGGPLYYQNIHLQFCAVVRRLGLRASSRNEIPRIHDFRHSYAVQTLLRWCRAGDDVERLLPVLSTYLGHSHTRDTYWYLSACPELMEHAARRLEMRWGDLS
jgi:integrase